MITLTLGQVCVGKRVMKCRRVPHNFANKRVHWSERYRWGEAWKSEVGYTFMAARPRNLKLPLKFAKITVILSVIHLFDYDGAYSCVKPILDALKVTGGVGVIIDDSPQYVDLSVQQKQVRHKADEGVEIRIEE